VSDPSKKLPWHEIKTAYLAHLQGANEDAALIAVADKLHNARAILSDYRELGEQLWLRFNAPKEDQLWYYCALVDTLRQTVAPKVLVDELAKVVKELKESARLPQQGVATT
jgi:(p)ppGpp synthase/HD superfamily hydrolase